MSEKYPNLGLRVMGLCDRCRWLGQVDGREACTNPDPWFGFSNPLNTCEGFAPKRERCDS